MELAKGGGRRGGGKGISGGWKNLSKKHRVVFRIYFDWSSDP